jgi:hypothetical protein
MYFRLGKGTAWLIGSMLLFLNSAKVIAQENIGSPIILTNTVKFSAMPANCVALHQGRKCYAKVSFLWQTSQLGNFCIYQKVTNKVIQCWKNSRGNQVDFEFESSEKLEYQLVAIGKKRVIAETSINVSWVHKASPRKRRWRLF